METFPDQAKKDLVRMFEILDYKEESDEGRVFSPVTFSSCRAELGYEFNQLLMRLKAAVVS